jgi:DNA-binding transcriptional LysR family regulator
VEHLWSRAGATDDNGWQRRRSQDPLSYLRTVANAPRDIVRAVDVRQLRYFAVLAEERHFGRAAQKLRIAQPALSQQIKSLESELGLRLLERTSRGVVLTDPGRRFLSEARGVVDRFDEAVETMRRVKQGTVGTLRVGVFPGPLRGVVPPALVELRTELPEVIVETRFIATDEQLRALLEARLDLALLPSLGELNVPAPLRTQVVQREPLGIAVPAAHPIANQGVLGANDLLQLPLVFMSRDGAAEVYETVIASLRGAGVQPRSVLESSTPESSLSIVAAGLAFSVKTKSEVDTARGAGEGVIWKRLARFDLELTVVAAWDTTRVTPALRLLIDVLTDKPWLSRESNAVLDTS